MCAGTGVGCLAAQPRRVGRPSVSHESATACGPRLTCLRRCTCQRGRRNSRCCSWSRSWNMSSSNRCRSSRHSSCLTANNSRSQIADALFTQRCRWCALQSGARGGHVGRRSPKLACHLLQYLSHEASQLLSQPRKHALSQLSSQLPQQLPSQLDLQSLGLAHVLTSLRVRRRR